MCVCICMCVVCTSPSLLTMTSMSGCLLASFIWLVRGASDTLHFYRSIRLGYIFFISEVFPVQQQHQGMKEDDEDMSLSGMQCGHLAFVMLTSMHTHTHTHTHTKKKSQSLGQSFPTGTRTPVLRDFQEEFPVILRISYTNHLYYGEQ